MRAPGFDCRIWLSFLLALAAFCAGCHAKPAAPASEAAQPSPQQASMDVAPDTNPDTRPVIVAFGDSLTAGYGADTGQSYPDFLQKDLDAAGFHYHVVNAGVSGNTTKDGVARLSEVTALHPRVVIVAFGGNDGLRGLPIATTRQNLETMIRTLTQSGAKVVLGGITLPPNYGADYIQQFNETYSLLARQHHLPWLPFLLRAVYGTPGGMQEDGIHATGQGNAQVARNVFPLVAPLLQRQ